MPSYNCGQISVSPSGIYVASNSFRTHKCTTKPIIDIKPPTCAGNPYPSGIFTVDLEIGRILASAGRTGEITVPASWTVQSGVPLTLFYEKPNLTVYKSEPITYVTNNLIRTEYDPTDYCFIPNFDCSPDMNQGWRGCPFAGSTFAGVVIRYKTRGNQVTILGLQQFDITIYAVDCHSCIFQSPWSYPAQRCLQFYAVYDKAILYQDGPMDGQYTTGQGALAIFCDGGLSKTFIPRPIPFNGIECSPMRWNYTRIADFHVV